MALTAEIADGWLPIYYSPKVAAMYQGWLDEGFAKRGDADAAAAAFEIAPNCSVVVTDDVDAALDAMRPTLGFYIGGMGAKDMNFHKQVFARMGYEREADADPGPVLRGQARRGHRRGAAADGRRHLARRLGRARSATTCSVGGGRRHDARRRRARPSTRSASTAEVILG